MKKIIISLFLLLSVLSAKSQCDVLDMIVSSSSVTSVQPYTSVFFASPSYLEIHGRPQIPRELLDHRCIRHKQPTSGVLREWRVSEDGQDKRIDPPARLVFDSAAGVIQAAREGHGIGWSMRVTMQDHIRTGELETLLDAYAKELPPFYVYYPEQNKRVECLRLLVNFLSLQQSRQSKN